MIRRRKMVFGHRPRRLLMPIALLLIVIGAVGGAYSLTHHPMIDVRGMFTMFQPLRCQPSSTTDIFHVALVFTDQNGKVVGEARPVRGVRRTTETVRGFSHCREVGSYSVRLPKEDSYRVDLPAFGQRIGPVSLTELAARRYRYDVFYCCGK
jgi:hypothetical protein